MTKVDVPFFKYSHDYLCPLYPERISEKLRFILEQLSLREIIGAILHFEVW